MFFSFKLTLILVGIMMEDMMLQDEREELP